MRDASMPMSGGERQTRTEHAVGNWFERLARFGLAAKGVVYILVGALAAIAAVTSGGQVQGSEGALRSLVDEPLGQVLLGAVALGLFSYAIWRLIAAVDNPENDETAKRVFYGVTAVIYGGLAFEAARLAVGGAGAASGTGNDAAHWTARVMAEPFGIIAIAIAGLLVAGYGVHQIIKAVAGDVADRMDLHAMRTDPRRWVIRFGRFGLAARGVVLTLIGVFLGLAALNADPGQARGLGGALRTLEQQPYGPWLLGAVALGLVAYGLFQLVKARYRRIATP